VNGATDQQLLRDYRENRSETAFSELVRRHVDHVYSAALRMVRDAHLAQDVSQGVFVALAMNAGQLVDRSTLSGWLHCTARNLAVKLVRTDARRRTREEEAAAMNPLLSAESDASWEGTAPHLDAALGELSESDRDAITLRYFEKKSALEMAGLLGISDEAAQKRVSRAVDRLRELMARRGVTVGAGGLVAVLSANAVQAAPLGLAGTISAVVLSGTTLTTTAGAAAAIAMTTLQKSIVVASVAVLAGTGIYEARQVSQLHDQVQTLRQQNEQQRQESESLSNRLAIALRAEPAPAQSLPNAQFHELLRLRGEVSLLRRQSESLAKMLSERQAPVAEYEPSASWIDSGDATPEAAASTFAWAVRSGNGNRLAEILEFESEQGITNSAALAEQLASGLQPLMSEIDASRLLVKDDTTPDEVTLWFQSRLSDGQSLVSPLTLKRVGDNWKIKLIIGRGESGVLSGD